MVNTGKIIFKSLSSLNHKKLKILLCLNVRHPLFSLLSFFATIKAFQISGKLYPQKNSGDGVENAFRHALWCMLILMYCCKISSPSKALSWCKSITDLHEDLFPNEPLQKKMDLHNNEFGMNLFNEMLNGIHRQFFETQFFIDVLQKKMKSAQQINDNTINLNSTELVYID